LAFVRGARAASGSDGEYEFTGVPAGAYHVYAYVGDNPRYFNRQTKSTRVLAHTARAEDLELGMVLERLEPRAGEVIAAGGSIGFRWSECPGAAEYVLTIVEEPTGEEVFATRTQAPDASVPQGRFTSGHTYVWRVTAESGDGAFLGASPGAGGQPWSFTVR
jgi:hypothetical protein